MNMCEGDVGYNIRYATGEINTGKFNASFDYSLDLIKMREVFDAVYNGARIYKRKEFSFFVKGYEYTTRVVNVNFNYSIKAWNRVRPGVYVRLGYNATDLKFEDCLCYSGEEVVGIMVDTEVEHPIDIKHHAKYFTYEDGCYKAKTNIKTMYDVAKIREILYRDGFYMDGVHYVRYKRSAGSSRVGKCLFIDELLYPRMHEWELCGLTVQEGQSVDLAGMEAYIALSLSSIIDTLEIQPENILLINDYESKFTDKVIAIGEEDCELVAYEKECEIANSIWDGQSLMDKSLFGKYDSKGFLLLRNRFFKSACFNANIQRWFADNGITSVDQLIAAGGRTRAKRIEDVKLITTPSSIKYLKFASFDQWLDNLDPIFGVVKYEKPTHYMDGRMVQTHYQLLQTLQMTREEVDEFLRPSIDYINMVKANPAVMRYHISYPEDTEFELTPLTSKNDVVYKMLGINDDFAKTKIYASFLKDVRESFMLNLRCGHVLVNGNYSTMVGNGVEMLMAAIGRFDGKSILPPGTCCTYRFDDGQKILGSRSPHVSIGNVWLTTNARSGLIDRYFNMTSEIIYVNSIGENLLSRLSGCDFDSDTVMITDNDLLIRVAERNYENFGVATSLVPARKIARTYTPDQLADLDIRTSVNKIGEIINLAQELNTIIWNTLNSGGTLDDVKELYLDVSKLNVLSNIEI